MTRTHKLRRIVMVAAVVGALALGSLSVTLAGIGTSPSNATLASNHPTVSGVALNLTGISGESQDDKHAGEIEILSW